MLCIWVCALLCLHQLLDVGTEPQPYAFAKLYMAMENNPQLGGVCGCKYSVPTGQSHVHGFFGSPKLLLDALE